MKQQFRHAGNNTCYVKYKKQLCINYNFKNKSTCRMTSMEFSFTFYPFGQG